MEWRPIETAPKGGRVLVYCPKEEGREICVAEYITKRHWFSDIDPDMLSGTTQPTHWMPLPPPPSPSP